MGWTVATVLAGRCQVTVTYFSHPCAPEATFGTKLDLGDVPSISDLLDHVKPDVIIHLAALTDPDRCEQEPDLAFRVNFEATHELASLAQRLGARFVFVSTDLVFDGTKGLYTEEDTPRPLSIYGVSKLRAEEAALGTCSDALILRSSLIYGFGSPVSKTFLVRLLERLARGEPMQVFTDQKRNPILVNDLAEAIVSAAEKDLSGLYHVGGAEIVSRYDFGQKVCEVFGCDKSLLVPVRMDEFAYLAERPLDSTLSTSKFRSRAGFFPCRVVEGLERIKQSRPADP